MTKKMLIVTFVMLLSGALVYSAAAWGPHHGWGGDGSGPYMYMRGPGACWWNYGNLTEEQQAKLDDLDRKFYEETRKLRSDLWNKRAELDKVMSSENPDRQTAKKLQNEISQLQAQLRQKRLDYEFEAAKIAPRTSRSRMMKGGRGYGMGRGPGACWRY